MAKYNVIGVVSGSKYLGEVEAESAEEAIAKGWNLDNVGVFLCHQCSSECEDAEISDIDVDPVI